MSDLKDQIIHTRSLGLAEGYINCTRMILDDLWGIIPDNIKAKYHMQKLEDGRIDIQLPDKVA